MWKFAFAVFLLASLPAHAAQLVVGVTPNETELAFDAPLGTVVANLDIRLNNNKPFTGTVQLEPPNPAFAILNKNQLIVNNSQALAALAGRRVVIYIQIAQ